MNAIPSRMSARSKTFVFIFLSLNIITPQMNDIITELRRTSETTDIIESGSLNEVKYAKSPRQMNMDMSEMAQLHRKGVVLWREGYQISPHITDIMIIW